MTFQQQVFCSEVFDSEVKRLYLHTVRSTSKVAADAELVQTNDPLSYIIIMAMINLFSFLFDGDIKNIS